MSAFEEGFKLVGETFGGGKDNLISLATIATQPGCEGRPRPVVRTVDAYYEDGAFYVITNAKSGKMLQIENNPEVSIAGFQEMFTASGIGENIGWALKPENAAIRQKLRDAFRNWYDMANNENDPNCCFLKITLTKGTLNVNHWEKLYHMDFVNRVEMENGGIF